MPTTWVALRDEFATKPLEVVDDETDAAAREAMRAVFASAVALIAPRVLARIQSASALAAAGGADDQIIHDAEWLAMIGTFDDTLGDSVVDGVVAGAATFSILPPAESVASAVVKAIRGLAQFAAQLRSSIDGWIANRLGEGVTGDWGVGAVIDALTAKSPLSQSSADNAAETATQAATNAGLFTALEVVQPAAIRWVSRRDERVRPSHVSSDTETVPFGTMFDVGGFPARFPGDPDLPIGERINCFPADTVVASYGIEGSYRRWYEGPMVTVRTRSGRVLTGTPNHPALSDRGWISLGSLAVGDHLVGCSTSEDGPAGVEPHVQRAPTPIGQVHDALAVRLNAHRMPGMAMDFHGDGMQADVDVVPADGLLRVGHHAAHAQQADEFEFAGTDLGSGDLSGERLALHLLLGGWRRSPGDVRSLGETPSLVGAGAGHARGHRSGAASWLDTATEQLAPDALPGDAPGERERLLGLAGEVATDEIIDTQQHRFAGHVFNLQTASGWYVANGIVVHNCRCTIAYVDGTEARRVVGSTKAELRVKATNLAISGRSSMSKAQLQTAVLKSLCLQGLAGGPDCPDAFDQMNRTALLTLARGEAIPGRHQMTRQQLVYSLRQTLRGGDTALVAQGYSTRGQLAKAQHLAVYKRGHVASPGEFATGSVPPPAARRASRDALFAEFGGTTTTTVPCVHCGLRLTADPGSGYALLVPEPIIPWSQGGTLALENLVPACPGCFRQRGGRGLVAAAGTDTNEHLLAKGHTKASAAAISNAAWKKKGGFSIEQLDVDGLDAAAELGIAEFAEFAGTSEGARKAWDKRGRKAKGAAAAAPSGPPDGPGPVTFDDAVPASMHAEIQAGIAAARAALPNFPHPTIKVGLNTFSDSFATKSNGAIWISKDFLDDDVMAKRAKDFGNSDPAYLGRLLTGTTRQNVVTHEYAHILDGLLPQASRNELSAFLDEKVDYTAWDGNVTMQKRRDNPQHAASIYALENQFEYVAEGLTDAIEAGDNARPDSKALLDIFRRAFP